jgi:hypothetical protein
MSVDRLIFRTHALRRMFERGVVETEVRAVLENGEVIRDYPDDQSYPSRLFLGWCGVRPLHVVAAESAPGEWIVITVYEPDPICWSPDFKMRITR